MSAREAGILAAIRTKSVGYVANLDEIDLIEAAQDSDDDEKQVLRFCFRVNVVLKALQRLFAFTIMGSDLRQS